MVITAFTLGPGPRRRKRAKRRTTKRRAPKRSSSRRGRIIKVLKQSRKPRETAYGRKLDRKRRAMKPGRRISRRGRRYTEKRQNRSDRYKYI